LAVEESGYGSSNGCRELTRFGLRIIRAMQPSAALGKTGECVVKRYSAPGPADTPIVASGVAGSAPVATIAMLGKALVSAVCALTRHSDRLAL
jgi:hypothetical protein